MKEFVINILKKLPKTYYYHCVEHSLYVVDKVEEIGLFENCTPDELRLLNAAALWHDTGFVEVYSNHEEAGCNFAVKNLPSFGFSPIEIEKICGMIMATKIPQTTKNKLEEIIWDADLEYLGTDAAERVSNDLFEELRAMDRSLSVEKWNEIQIAFLEKHHYFTPYCNEKRNPAKLEYLRKLINKRV